MKKKYLLLSLAMALCLSSCGNSNDPVVETVESEAETSTTVESTEETLGTVEFTDDEEVDELGGARTDLSGLSNEEAYVGYQHILDHPEMYADSFMELEGTMSYSDNCQQACVSTCVNVMIEDIIGFVRVYILWGR